MTEDECYKIINSPAEEFNAEEKRNPYWLKATGGSCRDLLDTHIQRNLKEHYVNDYASKFDADVDVLKLRQAAKNLYWNRICPRQGKRLKKIRETISTASDRLLELRIQKQLNVAEKDLKRKEEVLFLDQARIDVAAEDEIDLIRGVDSIEFDSYKIFEADVE